MGRIISSSLNNSKDWFNSIAELTDEEGPEAFTDTIEAINKSIVSAFQELAKNTKALKAKFTKVS